MSENSGGFLVPPDVAEEVIEESRKLEAERREVYAVADEALEEMKRRLHEFGQPEDALEAIHDIIIWAIWEDRVKREGR